MFIDFNPHEIGQYYRARAPKIKQRGPEWRGPCPIHGGKDDNFAVDPETGKAFCHSACGRGWDILGLEQELTGCGFAEAKAEVFGMVGKIDAPQARTKRGEFDRAYDYADEAGELLYQVVRFRNPKTFSQRRPDGRGDWTWGLGDVRIVPYRLPAVVAAQTVFVCYSADTEVLTLRGWVPFPELSATDLVCQYSPSGSASFVSPLARQCFRYNGPMIRFGADWCDTLVTPEHRMISRVKNRGRWTNPVVRTAGNMPRLRYLPVAGNLSPDHSTTGPSPIQVRLLVAWCADGVNEQRGDKISWNFKKNRKKQRIQELLTANGIPYTEHSYRSCPRWTSYRVYREDIARVFGSFPEKLIPGDCITWPRESREAMLDELRYWDGDRFGNAIRYFTANKEEADRISAVAAVTGWGCIVRPDDRRLDRPNSRVQYVVNLVNRDWRLYSHVPEREEYNGSVYCCTVPTGFIVTRRNGKTTIAGNCEGEKDADTLAGLGLTATCNNGGAGNFKPELVPHFVGKQVAIIPDNDEPGRKHAAKVAEMLYGTAKSIKILELPDLDEKGDVSDFIQAGGTLDQLRAIYQQAPYYTPESQPHEEDRYIRTLRDEIAAAGGVGGFWDFAQQKGIPTPFDKLTKALGGGLLKGEVYAIAARTGVGKTSMGLQFAIKALTQDTPLGVLMFSMEMTWRRVFQRLVGIEARVDLNEFQWMQERKIDTPAMRAMVQALAHQTARLYEVPLYVSQRSRVTPDYLLREAQRLKERFPELGLVVLDHMQLMGSDEKKVSEYEKFTSISRALKQVAKELDMAVLVMAQLKRLEDNHGEPDISDIRGSGAIEEDMAAVGIIYEDSEDAKQAKSEEATRQSRRYTKGPLKVWLKLPKSRFGSSGLYLPLMHNKAFTRFDLVDTETAA
jgi:KaiC/GvpD/RAD55 family RecA-like ATPase